MSNINISQGINYIGYQGDIESLMSQYASNLDFIRAAARQGKRFPSSGDKPDRDIGVFVPFTPIASNLSAFEPTKSYYVQATNPFTITLPSANTEKLNQVYRILPPAAEVVGGQNVAFSFFNVISFDNTILRSPISACIVPRSNAFNVNISVRDPQSVGTTRNWYGSLFFNNGATPNPTRDANADQAGTITHFEPGSSYFIFINYGANPVNNNALPTTVTTISAGRLNDLSYLLTEGLDYITTDSGDYIRVK